MDNGNAQEQSLKNYYMYNVFGFLNGIGGSVWGSFTYFVGIPIALLTYLGASATQIGMVTAIFWLGFALPQIPSAYYTESPKKKKYILGWCIILSSLTWLILGLYLMVTKASNPQLTIWLFLILFLWACTLTGAFMPGNFTLLFKIIPSNRLGQFIGIIFAIQFGGIALGGLISPKFMAIQAPMNFVALFLTTFVISIIISLIMFSIDEPEGEEKQRGSFGAFLGECINVIKRDSNFRRFLVAKWLMTGHAVMVGFILAYAIADHGFPNAKSGYMTMLHALGLFIGGFSITKIADKYGPKYMMMTAQIIALIYTVLALITGGSTAMIYLIFILTGLSQISDNVGYTNMCLFSEPGPDKSKIVAVTNVGIIPFMIFLPIFMGKLITAGVMGYKGMFSINGLLMVLAILFIWKAVDNPEGYKKLVAQSS